jgi:hypothetical protein
MSLRRGAWDPGCVLRQQGLSDSGSEGRRRSSAFVRVDLAANLFAFCPSKALQLDLAQTQFHLGDIEARDPTAETFDAVACVFGIFFLPDTQQASLANAIASRRATGPTVTPARTSSENFASHNP